MRIIFSILFITMLASCTNNANNKTENDSARIREIPADSTEVSIEELDEEDFYVWKVDAEGKNDTQKP